MKKNLLPQVEITAEDVAHLKSKTLRAHRRYLVTGTDSSHRLYKRLAAAWLKAKQKRDSQLAAKSQKSMF